jgi:hypothetical protein
MTNTYTNANASIDVHSPSLFESASFTLTGVTNTASDPNTPPFSSVSISFGTEPTEITATFQPPGGSTTEAVPEPSAWILMAGGLALVGLGKVKKSV